MFNVGDKVRVTKEGQGFFGGNRSGQVGVVTNVYSTMLKPYLGVRFGSALSNWHLLDSEVELVEGIKDNEDVLGMYF